MFSFVKSLFRNKNPASVRYELWADYNGNFSSWDGKLYKSDVIMSCIRPFATAIGKLNAKQIRKSRDGSTVINPDAYISILLDEPNPLMTGQMLQEKIATQLMMNNNAFIYINRDENGYAMELYPINAVSCECVYDAQRNVFLKFQLQNGRTYTFPYTDIIHLRRDYNNNDLFGTRNDDILRPVMEVVGVSDQSIVGAVKNSATIKWLLKYNKAIRDEDREAQAKSFAKSFLDTETGTNTGVAVTDANMDATQVKPNDYVPNAVLQERMLKRVYTYFNTNEKIVNSSYNEDEWNSYYEAVIEPVAKQLALEFTRKIFSRRERGFGNKIVFDASSLQYASMQTKLGLVAMVDRGAMTPNEWREVMNLSPIEGGDQPIRRLDTALVDGNDGKGGGGNGENSPNSGGNNTK